jgi:hypothetical protein
MIQMSPVAPREAMRLAPLMRWLRGHEQGGLGVLKAAKLGANVGAIRTDDLARHANGSGLATGDHARIPQ